MREIELKFLVTSAAAQCIDIVLPGLAAQPVRTQSLRTVYFDTPERKLESSGIAFRMRHDGSRWIQSIKTRSNPVNGLSQADEFEAPAEAPVPDLSALEDRQLRDRIAKCADKAKLSAICETVIERKIAIIEPNEGEQVELALDRGEICSGEASQEICEVELELVEGKVETLFDLAKQLFPTGTFRISHLSKGARGYRLFEGNSAIRPIRHRKAAFVELNREAEAQDAAAAILRECLEQITENLELCRHDEHPEGPHQLRVGLRRLRTAFTIFRPAIGCDEMSRLTVEAKWLGGIAGRIRDLDVIRDELIGDAAAEEPPVDLDAARRSAESLAAVARSKARDEFSSRRVSEFLLDTLKFIETRGWLARPDPDRTRAKKQKVASFATSALDKRWKKASKRARKIETLGVEERHELRKDLKKLRYTAEFFSSLHSEDAVAPFISRLKLLQDLFGDLNDVATLEANAADLENAGSGNTAIARGIGYVMGLSRARAEDHWRGAKECWRDLKKTRKFWR